MARLAKLDHRKTRLNADSVEWCPIESFQHILVCGTYQLNDELQERLGVLELLILKQGLLEELQAIDCDGILDCKWYHGRINGQVSLAATTATGHLDIYFLNEEKLLLELGHKFDISGDPTTLALSLDWSDRTGVNSEPTVFVSDSKGSIHVVRIKADGVCLERSVKLHDYEAWIAAADYWNPNVLYSGGDDCKLKCFDLRGDSTVMTSNKHSAGVTTMQSNFKVEHCLASASYDENVLFWDTRNFIRPQTQVTPGGGIWRVKWDPYEAKHVATACMYSGSALLAWSTRGDAQVVSKYQEHESINYGVDWCYLTSEQLPECTNTSDCQFLLSFCSFYDNLLSIASLSNVK